MDDDLDISTMYGVSGFVDDAVEILRPQDPVTQEQEPAAIVEVNVSNDTLKILALTVAGAIFLNSRI